MADTENVAQIKIETIDNTGKGLEKVSSNFDNFGRNLVNLEKNLLPIKNLLDGGIVVSGTIAGLGSLGKTSGDLSGAMEDLKKNLIGISRPASEATEALGSFGTVCDFIAKKASGLTQFFTIVRAGMEIGKKAARMIEAGKVIYQEYQTILRATQNATVAANAAESASIPVKEANATATVTNTTAKVAETNAIVAEASAENANIVTTVSNTMAKVAETTATVTETTAKEVSTTVTVANSTAKKGNTITTLAMSAASVVATATTKLFTTAMTLLNIAMATNPIIFWVTAITAAVAAIGLITAAVWNWIASEEKASEVTAKHCENLQKVREEHEKSREEISQYANRLELLAQKEHLTKSEQEEVSETLAMLNSRYEGLNLTLDDAANGFGKLQKAMAMETIQDAENEIDGLTQHLIKLSNESIGKTGEEAKKYDEQIKETRQQIEDARKRILEAKNAITAIDLENQKKVQSALKANADLEKSLKKEIEDESKSALQKELDAIDEKIKKREEELATLKKEGVLSEKQYREEMRNLQSLGEERKRQIEERYKAEEAKKKAEEDKRKAEEDKKAEEEAQKKAEEAQKEIKKQREAWQETVQKPIREAQEKKEDEQFDSLLTQNPMKALKMAKAQVTQTSQAVSSAQSQYEIAFQEAARDGVLDSNEKDRLAELEKNYQEAIRQRQRSLQKAEKAESSIRSSVQDILNQKSEAQGPLEALTKGSAEAFKKETELRSQQEKPAEKSLAEILALLRTKFQTSESLERRKEEQIDQVFGALQGI